VVACCSLAFLSPADCARAAKLDEEVSLPALACGLGGWFGVWGLGFRGGEGRYLGGLDALGVGLGHFVRLFGCSCLNFWKFGGCCCVNYLGVGGVVVCGEDMLFWGKSVFYSLSCWIFWWVSVWCHYRFASRSRVAVINVLRQEAERAGQA